MESLDKKLNDLKDFRKFKQLLEEMEEFRKMIERVRKYPIKRKEENPMYSPYSKRY